MKEPKTKTYLDGCSAKKQQQQGLYGNANDNTQELGEVIKKYK